MKEYQVFKGSFYVATNKGDADITITDTRTGVTLCTVSTGSQALFVAIGKTITADGDIVLTLVH